MSGPIYVVTMLRYNDPERHSYVLGVWDDESVAKLKGDAEMVLRAAKYTPGIERFELNRDYPMGAQAPKTIPPLRKGHELKPIDYANRAPDAEPQPPAAAPDRSE